MLIAPIPMSLHAQDEEGEEIVELESFDVLEDAERRSLFSWVLIA